MKFYLLGLVIIISQNSLAVCPQEIVVGNETFCILTSWLPSQQKMSGTLRPTQELSPYLNKNGTRPANWHLSSVSFKIWKRDEVGQKPVQIPGLRIFPYMQMLGGMHHGASYQFIWDVGSKSYNVFDFSLTQMKGCWSLRWTLEQSDEYETSHELIDITSYSNNSDDENFDIETLCSLCAQNTGEAHSIHN